MSQPSGYDFKTPGGIPTDLNWVIKEGESRNGQLKTEENLSFDIIIKEVKNSNIFYKQYLREQGVAMCKLRSNDYTIACFGMSQDNKYLLMEKVSCGNLQMYLKEQTDNSYYNMKKPYDLPKIMNFIHQIIRGIKSVLEMMPPSLFYSLSASNVLITSQEQCKLTGFATLTAVNQREKWEEQHNLSRPIRRLSPEAIKLNHIKESYIWSFGVLLWEITSGGNYVLYDIMCSCWMFLPHKRLSVKEVESQLLELTQYEVV
ncbi:hypothetical protein LSH36_1735g00061 [Paralvinella palmiformis]|uniref:Protein kinase domain-containing protein n=1 Tax=Paralvinella palmiformis TaxID=53620 RepID=A0AAD9IR68_9ANNE|nr:hypothetical protein LSH36_1735g00061 [Paralvinella palmiformis]